MKARLIRIGNSRGIRLPKPIIDEVGLQGEVEIQIRGNALVITSNRARAGWAEAARQMRERGEDRLLDRPTGTRSTAKSGVGGRARPTR